MPSTLITKYGSGAPLASDLVRGELAVDTENGRLYTETSGGAVVEIGLNPGGNLDVTGTVTADGLTVQKSGDIAQFTNGTRSAYLSADSGGFSLFTGAGQTGNGFYANEAGTYAAIYTNSSEKVRIDSSGNVGLKNSSPSSYSGDGADLVIGTTSGDNGLSIISGTSGTGNIYFGDVEETGTGSRRGQIVYDHVSDHMRFATAATERMRIDSSGNVGIGLSGASPAEKLHVAGAIATTAGILGHGANRATFSQEGANGAFIQSYGADTSTMGAFTFRQASSDFSVIATPLTISATGNVGIGTASPATKLAVSGGYISQTNAGVSTYLGEDSSGGSLVGTTTNNYFRFITNNTERMRIDSSGNVGIGTASPEKRLHIFDSTQANQTIRFGNPSATPLAEINYDSSGFEHLYISVKGTTTGYGNIVFSTGATPSERMRIDSSGNLYCSGGSGGTILTLTASSGTTGGDIGRIRFGNNDIDSNLVNIVAFQDGATDSGGLKFETQPTAGATTEAMRIDSSGNLLVGTTSAFTDGSINSGGSGALHIARDNERCLFLKRASSNGTVVEFFRGSISSAVGSISIDASSTAYNTTSDQRLKENIVDAPSASEDIDAIQVRSFDWKADGSHQKYGMVAQELVTVAPEAVHQPEDPEEMMGVDYSKLVPMMLKEIQSLRARVAQLEGAN